jgi:hypothetical protein
MPGNLIRRVGEVNDPRWRYLVEVLPVLGRGGSWLFAPEGPVAQSEIERRTYHDDQVSLA